MATKKSVSSLNDADLKGKGVFVRVDLNVPLDDNFNITDDTRIRAAVPTIKYLMDHGSKVILCTHLVKMANDCIGEEVEKLVAELSDGGVLLLENVRFHKEEEKNDPEFSKKLAALADVYVNDAFGSAHRAHASTEGVAKYLKPSVAGFLMQKELDYLVGAVANPKKPFAAIVGGLKVSTKIGVIESLLGKVDILILGGGMMFTLYKAQGYSVGSSLVEEDKLDLATSLVEKAKAKGVSLLLPTDVVIADKFAADANSKISTGGGASLELLEGKELPGVLALDEATPVAVLPEEAKKDKAVKHALAVRAAVTSGNYVMFFRLYKTAPNLNICLMDLCVEKMRYKAVSCISRSYRPTVPVSYIAQVLGFSSTSEGNDQVSVGLEECVEWLRAHGACLTSDGNGEMQLDTKVSSTSTFFF
ncbi:hypothetical protein GH714_035082 [Hevea brasiliensis]|uniref:Phosphoglycerate kinase n=1 Tax=Hevea brasiliensis TaxID=3981 RepID=A0A6A6L4K3_HEVBR|nr:hypothetical protein GH714_035082 [Hevea brasiliensis]